jgi:glucose-1-phosphate thymidylyltransferase
MKGLILAGGLGTRLRPLTHTGPKQLIPIANKPVLFYVIEDLVEAGITDIGIIVGYTEERINIVKNTVGDGSRWGARITYIEQDAPRGIAHAVYCAKEFMGDEPFVVYLGDNLLKSGIVNFVNEFKKSGAEASILLSRVPDPQKYGVAVLNTKGIVVDVEEKPEKPKSDLALIGVYMFTPQIFKVIDTLKPSRRGEYEITDAIRSIILSKKYKVISHIVTDWWDDTGTAEAILHANHLILSDLKAKIDGTVEKEAKLTGNIELGKDSVVKNGTVIKGPVIIGRNCNIGPGYIGPYTSIGDNTTIIGGEVESSIIIGDTRIEFDKKIVDSLIGRYTSIVSRNSLPKGYRFIIGENSEIQL